MYNNFISDGMKTLTNKTRKSVALFDYQKWTELLIIEEKLIQLTETITDQIEDQIRDDTSYEPQNFKKWKKVAGY